MDESIEGYLKVIQTLDKLNILYYIGGSVASSTYGQHRSTNDLDVVADIRSEHIDPFVTALQGAFYVDAEMMKDAIRRRTSFNLIGNGLFSKIDIFIPRNPTYCAAAFERRTLHQIDPDSKRDVYVASPEDTILAKLEWYRMGHEVSENQWNDIQGILKAQKALDQVYMRRWAAELGVADLLERALRESDFPT